MAATNLRDYLQGIEQLIDSNQVEDALAHCRHVLKTFPKNIDTYRLMGKAYLESKRHSEASDLFQRVLSSIPDDFVSHIGMSIIREDEGHLDAAIWHMERAFESQPSNKAVQGEVRRLYGMREGYEPPKVRLTRGALARMYSHGDLHNQAISELRNALTEDAQRPDLQILLAEMHFKNNQPDEASAVCSQIIQKLPYCLYANRVMVDILRNTQQDVEATPYWERVQELDPYAAQVSTLKDVAQVPAESVTIDALELNGPILLGAPAAQEAAAPDFEKEALPDWLSVDNTDAAAEPEAQGDESMLSSLQGLEPEAGSAFMDELPGDDSAQDSQSLFKTGALQPDEIPDWLRELRPGSGTPAPAADLPDEPGKRWTEEFARAGFSPTGPLELDPPLEPAEPGQAAPAPQTEPEAQDAPDVSSGRSTGWLPTGELSWLDSAFSEGGNPADSSEPADTAEQAAEAQVPNWLAELNEADLEHTQPTRPAASALTDAPAFTSPAASEPPAADEAIPPQDAPPAKRPTEPAANWLDDLQASSGMQDDVEPEADADEPLAADADSTQRFEALGWENAAAEPQSGEHEEPAQAEPLAANNDAPLNASQEEQDTLNWLEGLAARRGAAEDELLTDPEQRRTSKPEWLSPPAQEAAQASQDAAPLSENLNWLDELAAAAGSVDAATNEAPLQETSEAEALRKLEADSPFSQQDDEQLSASEEVQDTTPGWLRQFTGSLEGADLPNEPIAPRPLDDAPDWLSELRPRDEEPQAAAAQPEPSAETDIPDWLSQLSQEQDQAASQPHTAPPSHSHTVPDWLRQLSQQETNGSAPAQPAASETPADGSPERAEEEPGEGATAPAPAIEPTWVPANQLAETPSTPDAEPEEPAGEAAGEAVEYETITFSGSISEPVNEEPQAEAIELPEGEDAALEAAEYTHLAEETSGREEDAYSASSPDVEAGQPEEEPLRIEAAADPEPEPMPEPAMAAPSALQARAKQPARKRSRGLSPEELEDRLAGARQALSYGNISDAAEGYSYFLRRRIRLDEVIADLRAASRRFPRQVAVWQTLGDAYMRNNELTEALECYNRAKALL